MDNSFHSPLLGGLNTAPKIIICISYFFCTFRFSCAWSSNNKIHFIELDNVRHCTNLIELWWHRIECCRKKKTMNRLYDRFYVTRSICTTENTRKSKKERSNKIAYAHWVYNMHSINTMCSFIVFIAMIIIIFILFPCVFIAI